MNFLNSVNTARFLLLVQVCLIVSSVSWEMLATFWLSFVFPIAFAFCGALLARSKKWFFTYLGLSVLALFAGYFGTHALSGFFQLLCLTGAFVMLLREIIRHSFFKPEVAQWDRVVAGVTGYLTLGFFWFLGIVVATQIEANAFLNQITSEPPELADQLYFSFVTLTTLGYGDIVPTNALAKLIVMLSSLSGVLYLAVFISALIGSASSSDRA